MHYMSDVGWGKREGGIFHLPQNYIRFWGRSRAETRSGGFGFIYRRGFQPTPKGAIALSLANIAQPGLPCLVVVIFAPPCRDAPVKRLYRPSLKLMWILYPECFLREGEWRERREWVRWPAWFVSSPWLGRRELHHRHKNSPVRHLGYPALYLTTFYTSNTTNNQLNCTWGLLTILIFNHRIDTTPH